MHAALTRTLLLLALLGQALGAEQERPLNFHPVAPEDGIPRAMWIWQTELALEGYEREQLFRFCKQRRIERLFLYTGSVELFEEEAQRKQLQAFLGEAHTQGIAVEGLDGWPEAIEPEQQEVFLASLRRLLDYNASVGPQERFVGFQSDVEPGGLKGYHGEPERRIALDRLFLQLHERCQALATKRGGEDFVFGLAASALYDGEREDYRFEHAGETGWVIDHLAQTVDYLAMMSYHDRASATARSVTYELELAARLGKPLYIGQETMDVFGENIGPRSLTFYEEGVDFMEEQLALLATQFGEHAGLGGFAIHHYAPYRRLPTPYRLGEQVPELTAQLLKQARVDASSAEWSPEGVVQIGERRHLIYGRDGWEGRDDLSGEAWMGWDAEALHLYVRVRDEAIQQFGSGPDLWKGDHVESWIQLREGDEPIQLGFSPGDFADVEPNTWVWYPKSWSEGQRAELAAGLELSARRTEEGYVLECRIPVKLFGLEGLRAGDSVRFSCEIGDADRLGQEHESLLSASPVLSKNAPETFPKVRLL